MSYAPDYTPTTSFADDESNQASGRSTLKTASVDIETADISASINALNANLQKLQRDDDKLRDFLVEPYALAEQTRAMMAALGRAPRGEWAIDTNYAVGDLVQRNAVAYMCQVAHNSGPAFNLGFWLTISGDGSAIVSAELAQASQVAAAASQAAAGSAAATAVAQAAAALISATSALSAALAAQNSADSIAALTPVNLSDYMLGYLGSTSAALARTSLAVTSTADQSNTSDVAKGDALWGVKSSLASTAATTQHEVNERTRSVFDWLTTAERAAVRAATVLDITTNVQAAINSGYSLWFPEGAYFVRTLIFDKIGKTYRGDNAQIVGIDTAPQKGVIDYRGSSCRFYGLSIVAQWKSNYVAGIWWHSASAGAPAKSNSFYGLSFDNVLVGILFGDLVSADPLIAVTGVTFAAAVDAAQSENYVYGCRMRGVEQSVYSNQPNGFLKIVGGEIYCSKSEWDIQNPAIYSYSRSCIANVTLGVVSMFGDLGKTDTQLGSGFKVQGGGLAVSGNVEIASQILTATGGTVHIQNITGGFWGNASTDWANLSGTSGSLIVSNVVINKAAGAAAAATALVNFSAASGWDVVLDNVRAENQLYWVFRGGAGTPNRWVGNTLTFKNCTAPLAGGAVAENPFQRISTSAHNLLDLRGTDVNGNDITTWFKRDLSGTGTISANADVPAGSGYLASIQMSPTGSSDLTSVNLASLATVRATGIKCRPGDNFGVASWVRMTTSGQCTFVVLFCDAAGAPLADGPISDQTDIISTSWQYVEGILTAPPNAAYFGIGVRASAATVCRIVGVKVSKLS